jgi:hypothetical protein
MRNERIHADRSTKLRFRGLRRPPILLVAFKPELAGMFREKRARFVDVLLELNAESGVLEQLLRP